MQRIVITRFHAYDPLVGRHRQWAARGTLCTVIGLACLLPAQISAAADASHCTAGATRAAVLSFIQAFNQGNYESLDAQFAHPPAFLWYSSLQPGKRYVGPSNRNHLVDYFRSRHQAGDRFSLISFRFNGDSGKYGNFGLRLRRSSDNFRNGDWFQINAKGSLICAEGSTQFIVMTFGPFEPNGQAAKAQARS
jgi:hypothetical protein